MSGKRELPATAYKLEEVPILRKRSVDGKGRRIRMVLEGSALNEDGNL